MLLRALIESEEGETGFVCEDREVNPRFGLRSAKREDHDAAPPSPPNSPGKNVSQVGGFMRRLLSKMGRILALVAVPSAPLPGQSRGPAG